MKALFIIFLFLSPTAMCQQYPFVVLDVTGKVFLQNENAIAKIGMKVADNETIRVGKGGSVTLVCGNSGSKLLSAPGSYTISSADICKPVDDPVLGRLCKFAWSLFTQKDSIDEWRNHLDNIGGTSRGVPCYAKTDPNINVIFYCEGDFNISWMPPDANNALVLKVFKKMNGKSILELPVSNNTYSLHKLKNVLPGTGTYYWQVSARNETCDEYHTLNIVSNTYRDSVVNAITQVVTKNVKDKAQQQYLIGILLEEKHFFADAYARYREAAKEGRGKGRYEGELGAFKTKYRL